MLEINLQFFGGRGASSSLPTAHPSGGGGGDSDIPWSSTVGMTEPDTMNEALGKQERPMTIYEAVSGANPYYDGSYREYSENCQRAVIATEARLRGYDVIAQPTYGDAKTGEHTDKLPKVAHVNKDGSTNSYWMGAFKGAKSEKVGAPTAKKTKANLENKMKEYGNGSRAIMRVQWSDGGGHVLNVVNKRGTIHYIDGQTGTRYLAKELYGSIKPGSTQLVRTDNLKFSNRVKKSVMQKP